MLTYINIRSSILYIEMDAYSFRHRLNLFICSFHIFYAYITIYLFCDTTDHNTINTIQGLKIL